MNAFHLDQFVAADILRPIDLGLAHCLRRIDPRTGQLVALGAALASFVISNGDTALDIRNPQRHFDQAFQWPASAQWHAELCLSPWVDRPSDPLVPANPLCPLVYEPPLLYLRRYREYERSIATHFSHLFRNKSAAIDPQFSQTNASSTIWQSLDNTMLSLLPAAMLQQRCLIVTGGPGTGKTTIIARLLVICLIQAQSRVQGSLKIALAAPTGRAAERMAQSIRSSVESFQQYAIDRAILSALPKTATTLHRLLNLSTRPMTTGAFCQEPLDYDIIVVDEASMIDLTLMIRLLDRLDHHTQLFLIGDSNQLPSIDAGSLLADICSALSITSDKTLGPDAALNPSFGQENKIQPHHCQIHLTRPFRQQHTFALAQLTDAVLAGDETVVIAHLRHGLLNGVYFHEEVDQPFFHCAPDFIDHWCRLSQINDPLEALHNAGLQRVLTATRDGPFGAVRLNQSIEASLRTNLSIRPNDRYFHGKLILITENDHQRQLFNGDVGICIRDPQKRLWVWFSGQESGQIRAFIPSALPAHESAFAMTVHKAQGSEFGNVWLQLPALPSPVLSRELLYTGLTRARTSVHIAATEKILRFTVSRHADRIGGLRQRLENALTAPSLFISKT